MLRGQLKKKTRNQIHFSLLLRNKQEYEKK